MLRVLPEELQVIANNELNEKPGEVQENIRIIKEWILQQPHLNSRTDDQWILTYLRGCKFSLEKTKRKIDYYYRLRSIAPELLADRDSSTPEMKEFLDKKIFLPLETNTKGPQSILIRFGVDDIDHLSLLTITKFSIMFYDIMLNENDYLIMGQNFIYDLKGTKLTRLVELTLPQLRTIVSLQHAFPLRLKRIIVLNAPTVAHKLLELIKLLLGQKLGSRMIICPEDNLEEVYKHVPLSILPKEYGGEACLDKLSDYWKQKLEDYREWFINDAVYGTDESKRILTQFDEEFYGVDGSFRKLELD